MYLAPSGLALGAEGGMTSPLQIELTCRLCGRRYTPTADDIRRGPEVYHRCPACRPQTAPAPQPDRRRHATRHTPPASKRGVLA
jgi:hypothetical protein